MGFCAIWPDPSHSSVYHYSTAYLLLFFSFSNSHTAQSPVRYPLSSLCLDTLKNKSPDGIPDGSTKDCEYFSCTP